MKIPILKYNPNLSVQDDSFPFLKECEFEDPIDMSSIGFGVNLGLLPILPFKVLNYLTNTSITEVSDFKESISYICPFTGNKYWGAIPVAVVYRKMPVLPKTRDTLLLFMKECIMDIKGEPIEDLVVTSDLSRSLLGHGHTLDAISEGKLPDSISTVLAPTDNDNIFLILKTWKY